jgi:hypothetical protein
VDTAVRSQSTPQFQQKPRANVPPPAAEAELVLSSLLATKPLSFGQNGSAKPAISFGKPARKFSASSRALFELASRVKSEYPEFDSVRFRDGLRSTFSIERQFFDYLTPGAAGDFGELERVLALDGSQMAVEYCVEQELWPMALVIAHSISQEEFSRVTGLFIRATFSESTVLSKTLGELSNSTQPTEAWRTELATALLNFKKNTPSKLEALAVSLESCGDKPAADIVRIFARVTPRSQMDLQATSAGDGSPPREESKEGWFDRIANKIKGKSKGGSVPPPPPVSSSLEGNSPLRATRPGPRARDRYVNPF